MTTNTKGDGHSIAFCIFSIITTALSSSLILGLCENWLGQLLVPCFAFAAMKLYMLAVNTRIPILPGLPVQEEGEMLRWRLRIGVGMLIATHDDLLFSV